jgi:hypothetical protein
MRYFYLFFTTFLISSCDIHEETLQEKCIFLTSRQKCHTEYEYGYSAMCTGTSKFCLHNEEHCVPNPVYDYNEQVCSQLKDS